MRVRIPQFRCRRRVLAAAAVTAAVAAAAGFAASGGTALVASSGGAAPAGAQAAPSPAAAHSPAAHSPAASPSPAASTAATPATVLQFPVTYSPGFGGGLYHPQGVSAEGGVVYVSNTGVNVVTAVQDGQVTTVAGSLTGYGEHGDGGKATAATLFHPGGTAEDARGDIFIADTGDNAVREITPDGTIHRIVGTGVAGQALVAGRATLSQLDQPQDVAVTPRGDLLIADTGNNRVLAVTPAGAVAVVAGTGTAGYSGDGRLAARARLDHPGGVAADAKGDIYIADSANNVVRRVDAATGTITTVAGDYAADKASDGLGRLSGDGGPATSARLNDPQGVAVDDAGDLFIADTYNGAVREVTPAGTISTAASEGGPYAVAADAAAGTVYVADTTRNVINEILPAAVLDGFEDGTAQGWQAGQDVSAVAAVSSIADGPGKPFDGKFALEATADNVPADELKSVTLSPSPALDLSGDHSFLAAVDCYGGAPGATGYQATVTLTSGTHTLTQTATIAHDAWNLVSVDISSWQYAGDITGVEIGFLATGSATAWQPRFQLDDIGYTP